MSHVLLVACVVVPGLAAAHFILGARRPMELAWLSILTEALVFTPLVYPVALVVGEPTALAVVIPLAIFAALCTRVPSPVLSAAFFSSGPRSAALWLACGAWLLVTTRLPGRMGDWGCHGDTDVAFFIGMIRELAAETPARNPELAGSYLTYSSGYWFWYACLERISGLDTQSTLFLLGPLLACVLFALVHRLSYFLWQDRVAAISSVLLLWIPTESAWPRLLAHGSLDAPRPFRGFAPSLMIAWYNGPALVLLLLVLGTVVWIVQSPARTTPYVVLLALLTLFPFHHAMYFGITLCGLTPYLAWAVIKGRARKAALLCTLSWIPWKVLAWAWPAVMLAGDARFTLPVEHILSQTGVTFVRHAFLLPFALLGIHRGMPRGVGAVLWLTGVVLLPGPWAGPMNHHWQWDTLELCLGLLAGAGIGRLVKRRSAWWLALTLPWMAPNVALLSRQGPFRIGQPRPTVSRESECVGPPGLREAASWLQRHSSRDSRIATRPASLEGQYVEVYGARRLVFGDASHFDMAEPAERWRPAERDMTRLFETEATSEVAEISRKHAIGHAVLACESELDCPPRGRAISTLRVAFRAGNVVVLEFPRGGPL